MSMYDKDDWKKEISVGPEFQAEIPALLDKVLTSYSAPPLDFPFPYHVTQRLV